MYFGFLDDNGVKSFFVTISQELILVAYNKSGENFNTINPLVQTNETKHENTYFIYPQDYLYSRNARIILTILNTRGVFAQVNIFEDRLGFSYSMFMPEQKDPVLAKQRKEAEVDIAGLQRALKIYSQPEERIYAKIV